MSQDEFKAQVKAELREALAYFIERQKLVAQAMTELGLDLNEVGEFGPIAWASNPESDKLSAQDKIKQEIAKANDPRTQKMLQLALRASERALPQSGFWRDSENNEWRYFLHGSGCRLTNIKTGEPIDWDCPDVNRYEKWKFMFHLLWQLSSLERGQKLISTHNWVSASLEPLLDEITNDELDM
ncbi:MAG: DUF6896 domain-containing protein [Chloroflexota bacterium]|nr:hypothetical protein [Chloroflexota bacterium]MBI5703738.1 hypothetical protein [Chloroflexota bacterium]